MRAHPGIIVPPLPEKAIVGALRALQQPALAFVSFASAYCNPCTGRFGDDFVKSRCRGLEKFLRRVAAHPALVTDGAECALFQSLGLF